MDNAQTRNRPCLKILGFLAWWQMKHTNTHMWNAQPLAHIHRTDTLDGACFSLSIQVSNGLMAPIAARPCRPCTSNQCSTLSHGSCCEGRTGLLGTRYLGLIVMDPLQIPRSKHGRNELVMFSLRGCLNSAGARLWKAFVFPAVLSISYTPEAS